MYICVYVYTCRRIYTYICVGVCLSMEMYEAVWPVMDIYIGRKEVSPES